MIQLTKRKLNIGTIQVCLFIVIQIHLIIISFDTRYVIDFIGIPYLIYQVCASYLIISILILIRRIIIMSRHIVKHLNLLILLKLAYIFTYLSQYIGFYYAKLFTILLAIGMLIISIILAKTVFNDCETNLRVIGLRPIINAFIFVIASTIFTEFIAFALLDYGLYKVVANYAQFLNIIPHLFLINYFIKVKAEIQE